MWRKIPGSNSSTDCLIPKLAWIITFMITFGIDDRSRSARDAVSWSTGTSPGCVCAPHSEFMFLFTGCYKNTLFFFQLWGYIISIKNGSRIIIFSASGVFTNVQVNALSTHPGEGHLAWLGHRNRDSMFGPVTYVTGLSVHARPDII